MSTRKEDVTHLEALSDTSPACDAIALEEAPYLNDKQRTRKLVRELDFHILPLCAWIYLLNYLDRGNIGNSKILNSETGDDLLQQTGMTSTDYAVAISLFSIAYTLFDVPSNYIMKRYVRPSRWLAALLCCWGLLTIGFSGVRTYPQVVVLRFLIGVFEAGFFPGIVYLITFWYPVEERSVRIAFVLASATAAGAFGGCIAYGVGHLNVMCVVLVLGFLPDYPSRATFLSDDDKKFVEDRIRVKGGGYTNAHATKKEILATAFGPRMIAHYLAYMTNCVPLASLTFFTPTIVSGLGYTSIKAQLMTVPPWIVGYCACLLLGWSADRWNARGWHITTSSIIGGVGWLTAGLLPADAYAARYGCLMLCACGAFPSCGPLSAWVTCNIPTIVTMGIATALNNSASGVSQVMAQWIWKPAQADTGYPTGNFTCAACSFATAIIAVSLRLHYGRLNAVKAKDAGGAQRVWML
ncbi:MFS transporter [Teratosphaeria destructans]|uniref:MFS transporter n=1 Tax=Teratosphaeria destructans TaxID=418781 RepID=A0A9W7W5U0_9PEZI|nr:MFS transporter [Teratosphaeria destructans]